MATNHTCCVCNRICTRIDEWLGDGLDNKSIPATVFLEGKRICEACAAAIEEAFERRAQEKAEFERRIQNARRRKS